MNSGGVPGFKTGETPVSSYTTEVKNSYANYNDAALIVISRIGAEGADLPRTMSTKVGGDTAVDGARSADDHYLQLDQNETDLIQEVCSQNFKHVIIVLNCSSTMELGFLDDEGNYAYNSKIDGCLWIGYPGKSGIMALGTVLNGETNPSGRTVDTYVRDMKAGPTWNNFGNNRVENGDEYLQGKSGTGYYYVDYEEGIYVGYRYYETRNETQGSDAYNGTVNNTTTTSWKDWYTSQVVYPFGYGLSYTTFKTEITNKSELNNVKMTKDGKITVKVRVTNTGSVAGKQVVELYGTAPYTEGEIEKSSKVLVGYEKTPILYPASEANGKDKLNSYDLEIEVDPYYMASYDYNDLNKNNFKGYELEEGTYTFSVSENAHSVIDSFTAVVDSDIKYENDTTTGTKVENLFDDVSEGLTITLSRANWEGTWPQTRTDAERQMSDELMAAADSTADNRPESTSTSTKTTSALIANAEETTDTSDEEETASVTIRDLIGKDYDDPLWEDLLNEITFSEMLNLFNNGGFQTVEILSIGKPRTNDSDGPVGWVNFMDASTYQNTCSYASECVLGATWNKELLYDMGQSVGNEALVGCDGVPYTCWYAPAVNIHRSPFGGRTFEYFSEDSYLSGMMASYEIQGAMSKGVNTQLKHFALNEQETNRSTNGVLTWATEQSMRELYFKPFEMAVKIGGSRGVMSSFNRIGTKWAGGDYRLLTTVLRQEWGFNGIVISDYNDGTPYMKAKQMAYAGGNLNLATRKDYWWRDAKQTNDTDVEVLRENTKGILYAIANSNALNVDVLGYATPTWVIIMYVVDAAIVSALAAWGFVVIRKVFAKDKVKQ
jgi:beta-glucosidase